MNKKKGLRRVPVYKNQNAEPAEFVVYSSTAAAGIQVISTHSQTAKDHITLIDHAHVTRGDLHLRSDCFNTTSGFLLEDQTAGSGSKLSSSTVVVVDTGYWRQKRSQ